MRDVKIRRVTPAQVEAYLESVAAENAKDAG